MVPERIDLRLPARQLLPGLVLLAGLLATGCATELAYRGSNEAAEAKRMVGLGGDCTAATIAEHNKWANDPTAARMTRGLAIFRLFGGCLQPGASATRVHEVLQDPRWLNETSLEEIGAMAGALPEELLDAEGGMFCLRLFPDKSGWSDWVIYFALAGEPLHGWEEALAFLKGDPGAKDIRLSAFALCLPGTPVRFIVAAGKNGVRVYRFLD